MKKLFTNLAFSMLILMSLQAWAAPINDNCSSATTISVSSSCSNTSGSISGASSQKEYFDVWYKFVATSNSTTINVNGSFDAVVNCYTSCSSNSFASADNTTSGSEILNLNNLTVGATYYISVSHYYSYTPTYSSFTICAQSFTVTNDNCSSATTITSSSVCNNTYGTISGATYQNKNKDVWYKFIAQSAITEIQLSSDFDGIITLYSNCGSVNEIDYADNSYGSSEQLTTTNLVVGQVYYVSVSSYSSTVTYPDFSLCIKSTNPPTNDNCVNAITLTQKNICTTTDGTIANATDQYSNFDVWYKFIANATNAQIEVNADFDAQIKLFSYCGIDTYLDYTDNTSSGKEILKLTDLVIGQTYYISVNNYSTSLTSYPDFTICIKSASPVANDDCVNSQNLVYSSNCTPTNGTIDNATTELKSNDVWYKFVAVNSTQTINVFPEFDAVITLYNQCNSTSITYSDNGGSSEAESLTYNGLIVGSTYYVAVSSYGSSTPTSTSFIICNSDINSSPSNDNCTNAIPLTIKTDCINEKGSIYNATSQVNNFDVWYKFVATSSASDITLAAGFDSKISLFSNCNNLNTSLQFADDYGTGYSEILNANGLTTGSTYYVSVSNYSSSVTSTPIFDICIQGQEALAVDNQEILKSVKVFPTIVENEFNIEILNDLNFTKLTIRDIQGKIVNELNTIDSFNKINASDWLTGMYFVSIYTENAYQTYKVIKN